MRRVSIEDGAECVVELVKRIDTVKWAGPSQRVEHGPVLNSETIARLDRVLVFKLALPVRSNFFAF